jgi:hypothetical protein
MPYYNVRSPAAQVSATSGFVTGATARAIKRDLGIPGADLL